MAADDLGEIHSLAAELTDMASGVNRHAAKAVRETAVDVENLAKQLAPVDTGTLRRSIHHEISDDGLDAEVGTDVEYGPAQEFGTSVMPPAPYLGPALDEMEPTFVERLARIGIR